jgi:hypothetical protein
MRRFCAAPGLLLVLAALVPGAEDAKEEGFVPLFNGRDLTGWVNVNCAPSTFFVKDNEIVTTGKPTGFLRTTKQYENFIAEFDWMHVNTKEVGNSGFFVWADPLPAVGTPYTRGIEVQVLVNLEYKNKKGQVTATSHGDLFSIHGADCTPDRPHPEGWKRCLPSENRAKGGSEWNHYKVVANDGVLKLHVNGKEVSGVSACRPRKGYLALESEGAECHFRNLKIKELASTNPKPDEIAEEAKGFRNLYTGLDLSGWKADDEAKKHWRPKDSVLHFDGKGNELRTEKEYGDSEFIFDYRFPNKESEPFAILLREGKKDEVKLSVRPEGKIDLYAPYAEAIGEVMAYKPIGQWNRLRVTLQGNKFRATFSNGDHVEAEGRGVPAKGGFVLRPGSAMDFANLFVRELK